MKRDHPSPGMALPTSLEIYQQLVSASVSSAFKQETWEIGAAAIREWMARNNPENWISYPNGGYSRSDWNSRLRGHDVPTVRVDERV